RERSGAHKETALGVIAIDERSARAEAVDGHVGKHDGERRVERDGARYGNVDDVGLTVSVRFRYGLCERPGPGGVEGRDRERGGGGVPRGEKERHGKGPQWDMVGTAAHRIAALRTAWGIVNPDGMHAQAANSIPSGTRESLKVPVGMAI